MENKKNPKTLEDHITIWNIPFHPLFEHINPPISFPKTKKPCFQHKEKPILIFKSPTPFSP